MRNLHFEENTLFMTYDKTAVVKPHFILYMYVRSVL